MGSVFLAQDAQERGRKDIRDEEDAQYGIVLGSYQSQISLQTRRLRVAEIGLVEAVEEVHDCEERQDAEVELPDQRALGFRVDDCQCGSILFRHGTLPGFVGFDRFCIIADSRFMLLVVRHLRGLGERLDDEEGKKQKTVEET